MSHRCGDPLCDFLGRFRGSTVRIVLENGTEIQGQLLFVRNCVVGLLVPDTVSPFTGTELALIRCEDISAAFIDGIGPGFVFDFDFEDDNNDDNNDDNDESPESS
ncbi:hypothetical protein SAMN05877753_110134 [Bacillus oleivorans]|uniref:LSM domain-containing protein n=1 Tax=Bacillus oleivorans TaxID=1448271 RepID=A0A285D546_9BACI|nr:hypothetical protein [Bacillus oleivorans]SNX74879.1 hypothetical protein SAMN05877753_110134 [Bacillus oleivorans]